MTLEKILELFQQDAGGWAVILIIILSLIQIAPIKVDPWTSIIKWFGKQLGISDILTKVEEVDEKVDYSNAMNCRYRVIRAADEISNGIELSDEHLEQIGEDIEVYKAYCTAHPDYHNHKGKKSMNLIIKYEEQHSVIGTNN